MRGNIDHCTSCGRNVTPEMESVLQNIYLFCPSCNISLGGGT